MFLGCRERMADRWPPADVDADRIGLRKIARDQIGATAMGMIAAGDAITALKKRARDGVADAAARTCHQGQAFRWDRHVSRTRVPNSYRPNDGRPEASAKGLLRDRFRNGSTLVPDISMLPQGCVPNCGVRRWTRCG